MSDVILSSLIAGSVTLVVCMINNWTTRKKDAVANAVRDQRLEDSINGLSRRVDEHNGMMDKVTAMSSDLKVLRTDIEWLKTEHQK